jgi:hypothetical protein
MKWTVIWTRDVENELAALWLGAADRPTVTMAGDAIDAQLRRDPYANSESRTGKTRIMIESPLAAAYDVSDDDCMVTVWAVWVT